MGILLGKKKKKITDLPTLFFSCPLRQYNNFFVGLSSRLHHCVHKCNTIGLSSFCIAWELKDESGERADVPKAELGDKISVVHRANVVQWNLVIKRSDITKPSYNKVNLLVPILYISLSFYPDIMRNLI